MPKPFDELRERLLRAGVAPRHVRRYLAELADHLADLTNEELHAGRGRADADSAALVRLGTMEELAQAMISRRDCQSWCARAPWAMFSLAPLFSLAAAYFGAAFYLWCGWNLFLPEADTPFWGSPTTDLRNCESLFSGRQVLLHSRAVSRRMGHRYPRRPAKTEGHLADHRDAPDRVDGRHGPNPSQSLGRFGTGA